MPRPIACFAFDSAADLLFADASTTVHAVLPDGQLDGLPPPCGCEPPPGVSGMTEDLPLFFPGVVVPGDTVAGPVGVVGVDRPDGPSGVVGVAFGRTEGRVATAG